MRTRREIIIDLERTIDMAEHKYKIVAEYDLDPDAFNSWMFGWMLETIKLAKLYLEQL